MFSRILLVAAMTMGAAACVGDVAEPGDTQDNPNPNPNGNTEKAQAAKKEYEDKVYPIVTAKCGGCHQTTNPAFVGATKDASYAAVVGYQQLVGVWTPESAGISKIPTNIASHAGITYDATQLATINGWLSLEAAARAGGGGGPLPDTGETPGAASSRLLKEFQKCMSLTAFNTAQVPTRMAATGTTGGNCRACHDGGAFGLIASDTGAIMFNTLKNLDADANIGTYYLAMYYTPQTRTKPYSIVFNEAAFNRVGTGVAPFQNHPQFNLNGAGFTAVKAYLTEVKKGLDANGNCTTPPAT